MTVEDDGVGMGQATMHDSLSLSDTNGEAKKQTTADFRVRSVKSSADTSINPKSKTGTGQGLALHSTLMAVVGGSLSVESVPGRYTRVLLSLPEGSW